MGQAYEFNGVLYDNVEEFLEALAHAYKEGERELVKEALDEYGFELTDIGVRPEGI